jgi:hypothetical protein
MRGESNPASKFSNTIREGLQ